MKVHIFIAEFFVKLVSFQYYSIFVVIYYFLKRLLFNHLGKNDGLNRLDFLNSYDYFLYYLTSQLIL